MTNINAREMQADKRRYEAIIDRYLSECFQTRQTPRVSELADLLDASRPYLSRVIPQIFGHPLKYLLRERQMKQAYRLLTSTKLSIAEIAEVSGCGTVSTLYRQFVQTYARTPATVRKDDSDL